MRPPKSSVVQELGLPLLRSRDQTAVQQQLQVVVPKVRGPQTAACKAWMSPHTQTRSSLCTAAMHWGLASRSVLIFT